MTADKLSVFRIIGGVGLIYLFVYSFNNIAFQYFQSSDGNKVFERYMHAFYVLRPRVWTHTWSGSIRAGLTQYHLKVNSDLGPYSLQNGLSNRQPLSVENSYPNHSDMSTGVVVIADVLKWVHDERGRER